MKSILALPLLFCGLASAAVNDITGLSQKNSGGQPKAFTVPAAAAGLFTANSKANQRLALDLVTPSGWAATDKLVSSDPTGATLRFDIGTNISGIVAPTSTQTNAELVVTGKGGSEAILSGASFTNSFRASNSTLRAIKASQVVADFYSGQLFLEDGSAATLDFFQRTLLGNWSMEADKTFVHPGSEVRLATALAGTAIDIFDAWSTKTATAAHTFTFSGSPVDGMEFGLILTGDSVKRTIGVPSAVSVDQGGATRTSFVLLPAPTVVMLQWKRIGSTWYLTGDPGDNPGMTITGGTDVAYNLATMDTDGDSKINVLDMGAGMVKTDSGGVVSAATAGTDYTSPSSTESPTNKTFDASATGNVLKFTKELQFATPSQCDNTGAVRVTSEGATYGHATFSNSADKAGNYVIYRCLVPSDLDTGVDLTAIFTQRLAAGDTGKQAYEISMADVNSSAGADAPTFSNAVAINFAGDASGASGDIEISASTTLTSWRSSLTPGHMLVIKLARDGDDGTNDTSTQNSNDMNLTLKYGASQ